MAVKDKAEELCGMHKHVNKDMQAVHALITAFERVTVANELDAPLEYKAECVHVVRYLQEMVGESTLEQYLLNQ